MTFTPSRLRGLFTATGVALALALQAAPASAQGAWPSKAVRIIVGYPSGSSPDVQARLIAEPLGKALGQPVIVENRPGAGGNIGADLVAKAGDGHTIGVIGNGPLTTSKALYPKLPFDPQKDLAPVALIGAAPLVWTTSPALFRGNVPEYVAHLRAEGDKAAYGSVGAGSGGHLGMEVIKQSLRINPLHVPFNGGPAITNAIMGGQVQMTLLPAATVMPLVQAGRLAAVAVTSARRSPLAPDLPSMEEIGARGVDIEVWNAVMAPSAMPAANRARLAAELSRILQSREIRQVLLAQGWRTDDSSPEAAARRIRSDSALYGELIARQGIRLE